MVLAGSVAAKNITYNVVTLDPTVHRMCVSVDNAVYHLSKSRASPLLYTGQGPVGASYKYCVLDHENTVTESEDFSRPSPQHGNSTLNEIYKRTHTVHDIPKLPKLWNYGYQDGLNPLLHPDGHIATLHFQSRKNAVVALHSNVTADVKVVGNLTFISHNDVQFIKEAQIKLSGRSSRMWAKQSYNIKVKGKKEDLYGLKKFKLRAEPNDPTYMREKLYYDILRKSASVPARGTSWVRVIMDDKPIGLFLMADQLDKHWLKAAFNGDNDDGNTGVLYMGNYVLQNSTAKKQYTSDLSYLGDESRSYGENDAYLLKAKSSDKENKDFSRLAEFTKQIAESKGLSAKAWKNIMDVDVFLINMAIEFLQGHMDGYQNNQNNYYVYDNNGKWTWLSNDMDYVMGNSIGNQTKLWTGDYTQFGDMSKRPLMKAILAVPEFRAAYEKCIARLVNKLYNLDVLGPRIDAHQAMLSEDVAWDHSLPKMINEVSNPGLEGIEKIQDYVSKLTKMDAEIDVKDYHERLHSPNVTFEQAINGVTGYSTLYGLKQWIANKSGNIKQSLHIS
ncbi:hypothetical protein INT44_007078 [Umbelopsis vinacea]|uniref:Spore coat protein CotH n=1 Tax=Umbelopsis vinacea TaxID=44442 RepID=A0A8H7PGF1_9FUNG|nr:hypothetical protein INT44_007078 [Umbelopsis vinacea]